MKKFKKYLLKTSILLLIVSYALILFFSIWGLLHPEISYIILGIITSSQLIFIVLILEYTKKWFKHIKEWHKYK